MNNMNPITIDLSGLKQQFPEVDDPMSWIHKGFALHDIAGKAVQKTDVDTIVENEVITFLETVL